MIRLRKSMLIAAAVLVLLVPATALAGQPVTQTLNPPPPDFETCMAVGSGTICQGVRPQSYGPDDTGIVCGSGAAAFDIFDQGAFEQRATRYYDRDGNLTRRVIQEIYSLGIFSNPASGQSVSYTQNTITTDVLAIPGDFTSDTMTTTGEVVMRAATGGHVLLDVGRQVFNFDGSELISSAGPNASVDYYYEGDTHAIDRVCAALS